MPNFCVNLNFLFKEHEFLDRFNAAHEAGFDTIEFMFPYEYEAEEIAGLLKKNNLKQVLFNLPAGDWDGGSRGIAANPARVEEFRSGVDSAIEYAQVLDVERINCLAGLAVEGVSYEEQWQTLKENMTYASSRLAKENRQLLIEAINTIDVPGFFIPTTADALRIMDEIGDPNIKLQYDVYHMQRIEGNLIETISTNLDRISHIQIADVPGRHQPGTGEINYRFLFEKLDSLGYEGFVSLEYIPQPDTVSSLKWFNQLGLTL